MAWVDAEVGFYGGHDGVGAAAAELAGGLERGKERIWFSLDAEIGEGKGKGDGSS